MAQSNTAELSTETISLREVTKYNVSNICKLRVKPSQEDFVLPNAFSIAQAHFNPAYWFRAIYLGEYTPIGFVMIRWWPDYYLIRFMIDSHYQGHGYGRAAIGLVIGHIRKTFPMAKEITLSYIPGEGCPEPFYRKLGFEPTGEDYGSGKGQSEPVMRLKL